MSSPLDAGLRAADSDRHLVADLLTAAYADGRLTREELDERLDATWAARTFGDLTPLTADLVGSAGTTQYDTGQIASGGALAPQPMGLAPSAVGVDGRPVVRPQVSASGSQIAVLSTRRPAPGAPVAERTVVTSVLGEVKLDLRGSVFAAPVCRIDLQSVLGSVTIRVPEGVTVRDETFALLGESTVKGVTPHPGDVVLVVRGVVLLGSLTVKGPNA